MDRTKQCLLYVLSCALLFTGLSGLFSDRAFATSAYDGLITVPTQLKLSYPGYDDLDITSNYMGYMKAIITDGVASYTCDSTTMTASAYQASNCISILNDSLDHGDWVVTSNYSNYPGDNTNVEIQACDQKITSTQFATTTYGSAHSDALYANTSTPANCVYLSVLMQNVTYGPHIFVGAQTSSGVTTSVMTIASKFYYANGTIPNTSEPYLYTGVITYPDGYEGSKPPTGIGNKPTISPQFTYQLSDKKLTATDHNLDLPTFTPDAGYNIVKYQVEWTTFKCGNYDTSHGTTSGSCQSPSLKDHQILDQASDYSYTVDDYAHYQLTAEYLVQECYRYPSYPATPDYCFDVSLGTELPDYQFTSTSHDFNINGQSLSGDTASETCDVSGFCQVTAEDCTIQPDIFATMRCNFNNSLNTGLLNPSLNAFKSLMSSLVVPSSPTCGFTLANVNVPGGGIFSFGSFGSTVCSNAARIRDAFPIGPLAVNFLLALLELKLVVDLVNKLLNDKDNDVIVGVNQ